MFIEFIQTGDALKESGVTGNINERANYTANTGTALISTANSGLDGTGTTATVITEAGSGTLIKNIICKAQANTTKGMIRLFISSGGTIVLVDEIEVQAVIQSAIAASFERSFNVNYYLMAGASLLASTQNAERFVITALGLDISHP